MHVCLCFSRSLMLRRWRRQRRQWWCIAQTNTRLVLTKFLLMFQSTPYSVLESAINRLREFFEKAANKNYLSISHCIWSNLWIFDFVRAYLVSINKSNRTVCKLSATHWEKTGKKREKNLVKNIIHGNNESIARYLQCWTYLKHLKHAFTFPIQTQCKYARTMGSNDLIII